MRGGLRNYPSAATKAPTPDHPLVAPLRVSAIIPAGGTTIALAHDIPVKFGAGGNAGLTLTMSGGAVTLTYASGSGTTTLVYNLSRTVNAGETSSGISYAQPGNGIEAVAGSVDLANYTAQAVTNNSTQSGGDANWIAISTAAGVEVASRLENGTTLADWVVPDSTADHVSVDTTVKPHAASAGSFKFEIRNADTTANGAVCIPFAPKGAGSEIWFSYLVRADDAAAYQQFVFNAESGIKLSILSRDTNGPAPTGSNQNNEVVAAINYSGGTFSMYHQDGASSGVTPDIGAVTACSGTDFIWQPKIDNGANPLTGNNPATGAPWSACHQDRARYGGLYSAKSNAEYQPGLGDPVSGGVKFHANQWYRVTFCVNVVALDSASFTNRIRMWVAKYGEPYKLLVDNTAVRLGNGPNFNGLSLLPYMSQRSGGGRKSTLSGISGVSILGTGGGTALGDGFLEYVASTGAFRFRAANDSYGTARYISPANGILTMNLKSSLHGVATTSSGSVTLPQASITVADASAFPAGGGSFVFGTPDTSNPTESGGAGEQYITYTGKTGNTLTGCSGGTGTHASGVAVKIISYIAVRVDNPAALPGSGTTTATVAVTNGRNPGNMWYADAVVSSQAINAEGGYAPIWTPPYALPSTGQTLTFGTNTVQDVRPPGWTPTQINYSVFNSYGFGDYNEWYSPGGAMCVGGSGGHLHPDLTAIIAKDFTDGLYKLHEHNNGGTRYGGAGGDLGYLEAQTSGPPFFEINGSPGVPSPGHTYQNTVILPPSLGGGPKGSLMLLGRGGMHINGTNHSQSVYAFNLDTNMWWRVTNNLASRISYETGVVYDAPRGRYWIFPQGGHNDSFVQYFRASDGTFQTDASWSGFPPGVIGNGGRGWIFQGVLFLQTSDGGLYSFDPSNPTASVTAVTISGSAGSTLPNYFNRFAYYPRRNKFYWCPTTGGTTLNRLTPPTGNIRTGTWTHDTVTVSPGLTAQVNAGDPGDVVQHYNALMYIKSIDRLCWFPGGSNFDQLLDPA
jgi:hypothetical protein